MAEKSIAERVAEACGWDVLSAATADGTVLIKIDGVECMWFRAHRLADDAVLAAEKYGLFNPLKHSCALTQTADGWAVWKSPSIHDLIGLGTFCEAICQAILHLEEHKPPAKTPERVAAEKVADELWVPMKEDAT